MWSKIKPTYGCQIRVNRGLYYHHGIYESDDVIYQFASVNGELDPKTAEVCTTTLEGFLKGGVLEVREYTEEEKKELRKPDDIIKYAKAHLGEMGYDLISNNCEHFSNRCAFGKSQSNQVDDIMNMLMGLFQ
jgi:hypothetical protein